MGFNYLPSNTAPQTFIVTVPAPPEIERFTGEDTFVTPGPTFWPFFALASGTPPLAHHWEVLRPGQIDWQPLSDSATFSGTMKPELRLTQLDNSLDGLQLRATVTNPFGTTISPAFRLEFSDFAPQFFVQPADQVVATGSKIVLTGKADHVVSYQWVHFPANPSLPPKAVAGMGSTEETLVIPEATAANAGNYALNAGNPRGVSASRLATVRVVDPPVFVERPMNQLIPPGGTLTFSVTLQNATGVTYQWQRDGLPLPFAISPLLGLSGVGPDRVGLYTAQITQFKLSTSTEPAILGLLSTEKIVGPGTEVGPNIQHPNGNIFDQVLLNGAAASITAEPGQVTRLSYVDLNDDIVQVEFSGAGTLTVVLSDSTGPSFPGNYNQAVSYMKGHAGIVIAGADETTNLSIFSVGRITAIDQALFRDEVVYDGHADLAFVAIASRNGRFGGVRTANASYFNTRGFTGIYAPGVEFTGPVWLGDLSALETATPVMVLGGATDVRVAGGDLEQINRRPVKVSGITKLRFVDGTTSHGTVLPARRNQAVLQDGGTDVTATIVVNP